MQIYYVGRYAFEEAVTSRNEAGGRPLNGSRCSLPSDSSLVAFRSPLARTGLQGSLLARYRRFCTASAQGLRLSPPPCCGYPWSSRSSPSCTFPRPSTSTSTRARTDASWRSCLKIPSSSVSPISCSFTAPREAKGTCRAARTELTLLEPVRRSLQGRGMARVDQELYRQ
jgi:hypothetical protein